MGISLITFDDSSLHQSTPFWPKQRFFNETTMNFAETAFIDLALGYFRILNPFSAIVGQAGFNDHGKLILQY
jgi:hypothetical protein